jgi:hypothetical protein
MRKIRKEVAEVKEVAKPVAKIEPKPVEYKPVAPQDPCPVCQQSLGNGMLILIFIVSNGFLFCRFSLI